MKSKLSDPFLIYLRLVRLDKPIGIYLLLWPTLWALVMSSNGSPDIGRLAIFVLGVILMRSAGCIINDIVDKDFDNKVERTSKRVLTNGDVSIQEALILLTGILLVAGSLLFSLNFFAVQLAFVALVITVVYPFFKRFFPIPQAILGIAFGLSILMVYADTVEIIQPIAWAMFFANFFWALAYDTTYAMSDKEDDIKLGLKSSAITFGDYDIYVISIFQFLFLVLMISPISLMSFGFVYGLSWLFAATYSFYLYKNLFNDVEINYQEIFNKNHRIGAILFVGMLFDLNI